MKLTSTSEPASICAMSKVEPVHQKLPDTKQSSVASSASISAAPRNSGTRNTRILAIDGLEHRQQDAADGELGDVGGDADGQRAPVGCRGAAMPQGANRQAISEM